jgi:hypothetical protein
MGPADNAQPIDKWIWDNRGAFPDADNGRLGLSRPGQVQSFDVGPVSAQVKLTDRQLDRLRELTGNELKDPSTGLGARDALNALVEGDYPRRHAGAMGQGQRIGAGGDGAAHLEPLPRRRQAAAAGRSPDLQETVAEKSNSRSRRCARPAYGEGHDHFRRLCAQHRSGQWRHHRFCGEFSLRRAERLLVTLYNTEAGGGCHAGAGAEWQRHL